MVINRFFPFWFIYGLYTLGIDPGLSSSSPTFCTERFIHANDLNGMLSARPRTKCMQTKKYWFYRLVLGDGGDATPFCVSMTSKAMLNVLLKANSCVFPLVLHMDSTFKLNDNEFPLVVIRITDGAQQLHVLSVSIVSHHTHGMYMKVLHGLKDLVPRCFPKSPWNRHMS
jgi:hypothetical protein